MAKTKRTPKKTAPDWAPAFLAALAKTGNITESARLARVARATVYVRRDSDPAFADALRDAQDQSVDELERIARKRAEKGSDLLLIFLLKANRPEKYRERHEVRHSGATTVQIIEEAASAPDGAGEAAPGPAGVPPQ